MISTKIYCVPKAAVFNSRSEMKRIVTMRGSTDYEALLLVDKSAYDALAEKCSKLEAELEKLKAEK